MSALSPGELGAHRRPWLILALAGARMVVAWCLAWPLAALVAESGIGQRPEGDRALFEGGGYWLAELLRLRGNELASVARGLLPVLALGLVLTAAANAALLVGLNLQGRLDLRELLARALERLPAFLVLAAGTGLLQLVLLMAGAMALAAVPESLAKPVATSVGQAALCLVVALAAGALGGVSDVVKASLVRHESRLADGLARAFRCLLRRPFRATFGWVPWAIVFLMAAGVVGRLAESCDVAQPGAWRVALVFTLHQLVIVTAVAARAAWFARALRLAATSA